MSNASQPSGSGSTSTSTSSEWEMLVRRLHLEGFASLFLEAGKPLALLSAQLLYMGAPFLGRGASSLARRLEDDDRASALGARLALGSSGKRESDRRGA